MFRAVVVRAEVIEIAPKFRLFVFILMPTFKPVLFTNVAMSVLEAAAPCRPAIPDVQLPALYQAAPLVFVFQVESAPRRVVAAEQISRRIAVVASMRGRVFRRVASQDEGGRLLPVVDLRWCVRRFIEA
jgi:hypothetical protein